MSGDNSPMLKAAKLWAKTSQNGKRYLTGDWGRLAADAGRRPAKSSTDPSQLSERVFRPKR